MTPEEWNDIRHVVINKTMDISYHRKRLYEILPKEETYHYHLGEIASRIYEIDQWFQLKEEEFKDEKK